MAVETTHLRAILFDYGNTLIRFTDSELKVINDALIRVLESRFGPVDRATLEAVRRESRHRPLSNGLRENTLVDSCRGLVESLYDRTPEQDDIDALIDARRNATVEAIQAEDYVFACLERLKSRYQIGLVSNYADADAILLSLARTGLEQSFDAVVVSGQVGWVKPHARPFIACLDQLELPPEQALYVGDNWLADVQGASQLGMQAILTKQWQGIDTFTPNPGDHEPVAVIQHLTELEQLL